MGGLGGAAVPGVTLGGFEGEGLDGADAVQGFDQDGALFDLGFLVAGIDAPHRADEEGDDHCHDDAEGENHPGQRGAHPEQERQDDDEVHEIEDRAHHLAGDEGADLLGLADEVADLAGGGALEIVDRQAEQAAEDEKAHFEVEAQGDHGRELPADVAQRGFVDHGEQQHRGDHHQGGHHLVAHHLVDHDHGQQRGHHGEEGHHDRAERDVADDGAFGHHHAGQPHEIPGIVVGPALAVRPDEEDFAGPQLRQAQFVDRDAFLLGLDRGILQPDDIAHGVGPGHESGRAVLHEEDDGTGSGEFEEGAPVGAHGAAPQTGRGHPFDQGGGGGDLAGRKAQLLAFKVGPLFAPGHDDGLEPQVQRGGSGRGVA